MDEACRSPGAAKFLSANGVAVGMWQFKLVLGYGSSYITVEHIASESTWIQNSDSDAHDLGNCGSAWSRVRKARMQFNELRLILILHLMFLINTSAAHFVVALFLFCACTPRYSPAGFTNIKEIPMFS